MLTDDQEDQLSGLLDTIYSALHEDFDVEGDKAQNEFIVDATTHLIKGLLKMQEVAVQNLKSNS